MQAQRPGGRAGRVWDVFYAPDSRFFMPVNDVLAGVTLLSIAALVLQTVPSLAPYDTWFDLVEIIAVVVFTVEYFARVYANKKRIRTYTFSFFGIIDLLAVLPSYVGLTNLTFLKSARVLRILRLMRMVRLAKLASTAPRGRDVQDAERLSIQIYFAALAASVLLFGTLIYVVEGSYEEFASIPHGMLWAAKVTLGGVPQYMPHTLWGEGVTILARFSGLLLFGLLISIVGSGVRRTLLGGK